jgi:hypothetical protein
MTSIAIGVTREFTRCMIRYAGKSFTSEITISTELNLRQAHTFDMLK